jgi:hypothetical protein
VRSVWVCECVGEDLDAAEPLRITLFVFAT